MVKGAIPGVFMAAVEGRTPGAGRWVVAGFPVHDLRVTVYDADKTHAVDGWDIAFTQAGRKATVDAVQRLPHCAGTTPSPWVLAPRQPLLTRAVISPVAVVMSPGRNRGRPLWRRSMT